MSKVIRFSKDRAVLRIKARPKNPYKAPPQRYTCGMCTFYTRWLTRAWSHSDTHGPWALEGSGAATYELKLSAQAASNGVNHPRGERYVAASSLRGNGTSVQLRQANGLRG